MIKQLQYYLLLLIISLPIIGLSQPANDICVNATNIGVLPMPGTCNTTTGIQDGAPIVINGATINANPEFPYTSAPGNCTGSVNGTSPLANDVWYQFTSSGTTINIDISGLPNANVLVIEASNCSSLENRKGCLKTDGSGNGNFSISPIYVGQMFFLQVSSNDTNNSSDGNFTLSIDNDIDCNDCFRNGTITPTPAPINGTYSPGEVVQFCFELTHWEQENTNWFHGVQVTFGNGWDGNITNTVSPPTCQRIPGLMNHGSWAFYPTGIGVVNGVNWGPGFYFTDPYETTPDAGFGDNCATDTVSWTFCFELTVSPNCNPNSDLSVTINTSGDGESGNWTNSSCVFDVPVVSIANGYNIPQTIVSNNGPLCPSEDLQLNINTITGATYSWTGPNGFTSNLQNPIRNNISVLDTGYYIVTISENGCTKQDSTRLTLNSNISITPSSNGSICEGETLNLNVNNIAGATYSWSGPNGYTSNVSNPSIPATTMNDSGRYYINVSINGCVGSDSIDVIINQRPSFTFNADTINRCTNDSLIIDPSDFAINETGASYSWTGPNGNSSSDRIFAKANTTIADSGFYYFTINNNGCSHTDSIFVHFATKINVVISSNSPVCVGDTIKFRAVLTGDTSMMFDRWRRSTADSTWLGTIGTNPSVNIINATINDSGYYHYGVFNQSCPQVDFQYLYVSVIEPTVINAGNDTTYCENDTINLSATLIAAATYNWTGPNGFSSNIREPSINTVTATEAGEYIVTVNDNGCSSMDTINITVNPAPIININVNSPLCEQDTINLTANTIAGATYSWTGPNGFTSALQNPSINTVSKLDSGEYILSITDNGCSSTDTINVIVNTKPTASITANAVYCENDTINLSTPDNLGATYSWTGPNGFTSNLREPSINTVTSLATGDYIVSVDLNGCITNDTTTITVNPVPAININANSPLCELDTINLTANTIAGATYSWTGPNGFTSALQNPSINTVSKLDSGEYILSITDNGCSSMDTLNVIVNTKPTASITANAVYCENDTINLSTPNNAGATYSWTGPNGFTSNVREPSINTVTSIATGNYIVSVDLNGCITNDTTTITVNPVPVININSNSPLCEQDTINLTANTIAGATYSWTGPNGFTSALQNPSINTVSKLDSGEYILTIIDNGCSSMDTINVIVNTTPTAVANVNSPICETSTINLTAQTFAGANYGWQGPNGYLSMMQNPSITNATVPMQGDYILATQLNGCIALDTVNVTFLNGISLTVSNDTTVCVGDTVQLNASSIALATYSWTGPNGFISTIQNPTLNTLTSLDSGRYYITSSLNGCNGSDSIDVTVNPIPLTTISSNSPICENDTLFLQSISQAGSSITWNGPNGFNSALQNPFVPNTALNDSGEYSTITTLNGCSSYDTLNLTIIPLPTATITSNSPVCENDTIRLNTPLVNGATYNWSGVNGFTSTLQNPFIPNVTILDSGDYYLEVTANGCTNFDTLTVDVNSLPLVNANSNSPVCENDSILLNGNQQPGATYTWTGPNGYSSNSLASVITPVSLNDSGEYILGITQNGCTAYDTIIVRVIPAPIAIGSSNTPICEGDSILLTGNSNPLNNYNWSGPNGFNSSTQNANIPNAQLNMGGEYYYTITENDCSTTDTIQVVVTAPLLATINPVPTYCTNDNLDTLTAVNPGGTWSGNGIIDASLGSFSPSTAGAGNHTITYITDNSACPDTQTVVITVSGIQSLQFNFDAIEGCSPLDVNVTTSTPGLTNCTWELDGSSISTDCSGFTYRFLTPGCYDVGFTATNANGCRLDTTYTDTICVYPVPTADFNFIDEKVTILNSTVSFFNNSIDADSYLWTFISVDNSTLINPDYKFPEIPGTYQVCLEAITDLGCTDTICKTVEVFDLPAFYVPNSFSPNGDGDNEVFAPSILNNSITEYSFEIFDRWGHKIYQAENLGDTWDGTVNGELVQIGTYIWKVKFKDSRSVSIQSHIGHVNVIR